MALGEISEEIQSYEAAKYVVLTSGESFIHDEAAFLLKYLEDKDIIYPQHLVRQYYQQYNI